MKIPVPRTKIPVGISQCALGDPVRYNGGHKLSKVCTELLSQRLAYVPFCPEVAIGLGVPRKPIHLQVDGADLSVDAVRVVEVEDTQVDVTAPLRGYADSLVPELQRVRGFLLMQNSPSCGLQGVRRHLHDGQRIDSEGVGVFARRLQQHFPHLPMEEVGRLNSAELRENFLARVSVYDAWCRQVSSEVRDCIERGRSEGAETRPSLTARIIEFYAAYKPLLLAHHPQATDELGQLLADAGAVQESELAFIVRGRMMAILSHLANHSD